MNINAIPFKTRAALNLFAIKRAADRKLHDLNYLFWECTLRCNFGCLHCGSDCMKSAETPDMPLKDFLGVLDSLTPHITPEKTTIAVTGGEPLMRDDLAQCGKAFYERRFPWGIVTNGWLLDKPTFNQLLDSGLRSLTISLDGLKRTHDWFRGKPDSFERACNAIAMAAAIPDLAFDVATCATARSVPELNQIRDLLTKLGVRRWRLFTVFPKGRATHNEELQLTSQQYLALLDFITNTRRQGKIRAAKGCEGFLGAYEGIARDNLFNCAAGISIGSVLVDGSISACPSLRKDYIQGNIYHDSFIDVWNNRFQIMRERSWTKTGQCESCSVYKWCNGNSLHLRDETSGELLNCRYQQLTSSQPSPK